jgi:hypothetical protein
MIGNSIANAIMATAPEVGNLGAGFKTAVLVVRADGRQGMRVVSRFDAVLAE